MRLRIGIAVLLSTLVGALVGPAPAQAEDLSVTITSPANGSTGPSDISVTGISNADPSAYRLILVVNGELDADRSPGAASGWGSHKIGLDLPCCACSVLSQVAWFGPDDTT
ncbi:hypothetical protein OG799_26450 [Micromonospora sp. NBC_00898]|uniref:hypothetical protein n=1 Tax=Micromonospora sp. NBC_00898 TaxID=2975981 RepID=UPI0038676FF5|nr:hypothetical protein OG799_26450 [Micromonospora sp. NBC_00898]